MLMLFAASTVSHSLSGGENRRIVKLKERACVCVCVCREREREKEEEQKEERDGDDDRLH